MEFRQLFDKKPMIGMIHTGLTAEHDMLELAKREIEIYLENGVYPLIENYFGSDKDCEKVLAWIRQEHPGAIYGLNILGDYERAFELAAKYDAKFVQIDSVCGHLKPKNDKLYAEQLARARDKADVVLLGGVRFKYQAVQSGRSLEEDLKLGALRCDAIVCTGEGTGLPTPLGKVEEFKAVLGDFPVIVGAGVTLNTVEDVFKFSDGAIIGSWFKYGHDANYPVDRDNVIQMMERARG